MSEKVNHPDHYNTDSYECIDVMEEVFGTEAVKNFCKLNAFKYLWRADKKDEMDDIRKAQWYLEHMRSLDTEEESDEDEQESDEWEDVSEHLSEHVYDAFRNLYETISDGIKEGLGMYAESIDPESEASKRLRYFQYSKRLGYDEDVCFITALRTKMDVIEKRLKDEEEEDEQSGEKSGEK